MADSLTLRAGLGRNLFASEADGDLLLLSQNKVETSVYSALAASVLGMAAIGASAGTTQLTAGTLQFANSNGVSFGLDGATLTATVRTDYLTTAALSNHSHGNPTLALTNLSGSTASASNGLTISLSAAPPDGIGVSAAAGTQTAGSGTIVFANSNGMSFGMSGSSQITASYTVPDVSPFLTTAALSNHSHGNPTLALTGLSGSTASASNGLTLSLSAAAQTAQTQSLIAGIYDGAASISSGTLRLSNANGISFGINGQTLTASHNGITSQSVQTQGSVLVQGSSGAISFANSNGITFGFNVSTITASHNGLTTQTVQTQSNVQGLSVGTQVGRTGDIAFANSNGMSFGMSGSSQITASYTVPNVPAQTAQTLGLYGSSQTYGQSSSSTFDARSLSIVGSGGVSVGMSAGSLLISGQTTAAQSVQTQSTVALQGSTGALSFSNSNGITFGFNASTITASHNGITSQSVQTQGVVAPSAGTQTATSGTVVFSNSNGISFGMSGSSRITASYTVPLTAGLISAINVSGGTTSSNVQSLTFGNLNGVTFGFDGAVITASVAAVAGAQTGISGIANSQTTFTSGTVSFSELGAITIRSTTGNQLQFSVAAQSNQALAVFASSQTYGQSSSSTLDARSLSIVGSGGVSVGLSAGSLLISGQTSVAQSAQTQSNVQGISAGTQVGRTGDIVFSNSNGISFGLSGSNTLTASYTVPGATVFSNSNNVSFGLNGSTITASASFSQSAQTVGIYGISNTTGASSSSTVDARSLSFQGAGVVSVGVTNGSIVISAPSAAASPINFSAGTTSGDIGSVIFSNLNGVSFGLNGSTITASVVAGGGGVMVAASNTTFTSGTVVLVGASGIGIGINGNTISIYQPLLSYFANGLPYLVNSQTQQASQNTSIVYPIQVREGFSAGFMRMAHTVSLGSTSIASTAATQYSYQQAETHNHVFYSLGTGANSRSLQSFSSASVGFTMSINVSQNTTNNISVSHGITYEMSTGSSSASFSYAATNSTMQVSTTHMTGLSGIKMWDTRFAASMGAGRYWVAYGMSTSQTTQGTAVLSAARMLHSHLGISQPNNTIGFFGAANSASVHWQEGIGSYSNAGVTTASIALSQISSSASHVAPYIQMMNNA